MLRPKPWILAALAILMAAVALKYCGAPDERTSRRAPQSSPRSPVYSSTELPLPSAPSAPDPATSTTIFSYRERSDPYREPRLEPPHPGSLPIPSAEPQPVPGLPLTTATGELPPCPQPSAQLRSALTEGDWDAVHQVIAGVLDRTDCEPGRWRELQFAHHESYELARARRGMQMKHPAEAMRGLHLAVLAMLDSPVPLKPSVISVEEVSAPDQTGYRRVTGYDAAGSSIVLLTPQTAAAGGELTVLALPQPEGGEPGLQRDMIRYAPLVTRARELLEDSATLARPPEEFRQQIEGAREIEADTAPQKLRQARESVRKMAEQGLAASDALPSQSATSGGEIAARAARVAEREGQLYSMLESFLAFEQAWQVNPAKRLQQRGPEPP